MDGQRRMVLDIQVGVEGESAGLDGCIGARALYLRGLLDATLYR